MIVTLLIVILRILKCVPHQATGGTTSIQISAADHCLTQDRLLFFSPWWGLCLSPPNTGARPTFYLQTSPQACSSHHNTSLLGFPLCVFQGVFDSARGALKLASLAKKKKDETLRGCQAGQGNQKSTQAMADPAQLKQSPSFSSSSRLQ